MSQERPKMSQESPKLSQERPQRAKKKKSNKKHPPKLTPKSHVFLTFLGSNFGPSSGLCFGVFLGPCCFKNLAFCLGGTSKMLSHTICFRELHVREKVTKNTPPKMTKICEEMVPKTDPKIRTSRMWQDGPGWIRIWTGHKGCKIPLTDCLSDRFWQRRT